MTAAASRLPGPGTRTPLCHSTRSWLSRRSTARRAERGAMPTTFAIAVADAKGPRLIASNTRHVVFPSPCHQSKASRPDAAAFSPFPSRPPRPVGPEGNGAIGAVGSGTPGTRCRSVSAATSTPHVQRLPWWPLPRWIRLIHPARQRSGWAFFTVRLHTPARSAISRSEAVHVVAPASRAHR